MPLADLLTLCSHCFQGIHRYRVSDAVISTAITNFPLNTEPSNVLTKVVLINSLYRTQIYDVIGIAEHILTVNFDERLQQGDIGLVGAIRLGHGIGNRDLYSFATKYANWHRPTLFPIYDRLVKRILPRLNNRFHFSDPFTQADLHEYPVLVSTIDSLLTFCDLDVLNYKQLDQGLWLYAKFVYEREHDPLPEGIVQQIQNVENTMD